jgi:hypothetical protein
MSRFPPARRSQPLAARTLPCAMTGRSSCRKPAAVLVANMSLAVVSALVTIFAIGAEIGVVLASRLSDVTSVGQLVGLLVAIFVAVFALWYSHTAIRAITDSQAGLLHQRRYRLVLHPLTSIPGMGPEAFTWRRTTTNGQG